MCLNKQWNGDSKIGQFATKKMIISSRTNAHLQFAIRNSHKPAHKPQNTKELFFQRIKIYFIEPKNRFKLTNQIYFIKHSKI